MRHLASVLVGLLLSGSIVWAQSASVQTCDYQLDVSKAYAADADGLIVQLRQIVADQVVQIRMLKVQMQTEKK